VSPEVEFWRLECEERGPALTHVHGAGPNCERYVHSECPCRFCGMTPLDWSRQTDDVVKTDLVDPDSLPLALPQSECGYRHESIVSKSLLINDDGAERRACVGCGVMLEPKLATGGPIGAHYGIGRGWSSPRTKFKWMAVAHRAMRDREDNLQPFTPSAWGAGL